MWGEAPRKSPRQYILVCSGTTPRPKPQTLLGNGTDGAEKSRSGGVLEEEKLDQMPVKGKFSQTEATALLHRHGRGARHHKHRRVSASVRGTFACGLTSKLHRQLSLGLPCDRRKLPQRACESRQARKNKPAKETGRKKTRFRLSRGRPRLSSQRRSYDAVCTIWRQEC